MLGLIEGFLKQGVMEDGIVTDPITVHHSIPVQKKKLDRKAENYLLCTRRREPTMGEHLPKST